MLPVLVTRRARDPPIWLRFMFPSVPGFGSRIWMICARAFGWLTETHNAAMTCVDCGVEGIQAGVSVRNDMPSDPLALRRCDLSWLEITGSGSSHPADLWLCRLS